MALSKSVNYFVNTIYYDPIAIGALNTNDSEAIQSTLPHRAAKICLQSPKSAKRLQRKLTSWAQRDTALQKNITLTD